MPRQLRLKRRPTPRSLRRGGCSLLRCGQGRDVVRDVWLQLRPPNTFHTILEDVPVISAADASQIAKCTPCREAMHVGAIEASLAARARLWWTSFPINPRRNEAARRTQKQQSHHNWSAQQHTPASFWGWTLPSRLSTLTSPAKAGSPFFTR